MGEESYTMPPPEHRCPNCRSADARWLQNTSQDSHVNYYLCGECSHVWAVNKTDLATRNVTPLTEDRRRA